MKPTPYFWSALINGVLSFLILITCLAFAFAPISPSLALSLIGSLLPTVFVCGPIAIIHYRSHLLGHRPVEDRTLRAQVHQRHHRP